MTEIEDHRLRQGMRRAALAAGVVLVAACLGGCAQAQSMSPCAELTSEENGYLRASGVTQAGKAVNENGSVIFLSPTVFEVSGNGDRNGIDFYYEQPGRRGVNVSLAKVNTIPAELRPLVAAASTVCAADL